MIHRVTAGITRELAGEQTFEIMKSEPDFIETDVWPDLDEQVLNCVAHRGYRTNLHRVRDVVIVSAYVR